MRGLGISLPALRLVLLVCSLHRYDLGLELLDPAGSPFKGLPLLSLKLFGVCDPDHQVRAKVVAGQRSQVSWRHRVMHLSLRQP